MAIASLFITPDEYLSRERQAAFKSEYWNGHIYAMSGGSLEHNTICVNLSREVSLQLKGKTCRAVSSDMKVRTQPNGLYAYPDLTVFCGEPRFHDAQRDVLTNPVVIFEVLSPSTEAYDRGKKFLYYRQCETLRDYILIAQDEPRIEQFTRQPDDQWLFTVFSGLEASITIASIDCTLRLSEIYENVSFAEGELEQFDSSPPSGGVE